MLGELMEALRGGPQLPVAVGATETAPKPVTLDDLSEVRGQAGARRALEIAAAGGHNLLLLWPQTHTAEGALHSGGLPTARVGAMAR
jgi:magnesium chelatase family protein